MTGTPWPFPRKLQTTNHRTGVSYRSEMLANGKVRITEVWDKDLGWIPVDENPPTGATP